MSALAFTVFQDVKAQVLWRCTDSSEGIATRLRTRSAGDKHGLPLIKLATFGGVRSDKGSLRHDANVLTVTGAECRGQRARTRTARRWRTRNWCA